MKHAKLLGLAALALAIMAFAGAGTASAKVCSTSGSGLGACAAGHGNVFTGAMSASLKSGTTATLTSGFITVHCTSSSVGGSVKNEAGEGSITSMTFGGCTNTLDNTECTAGTSAAASAFGVKTTATGAGNGTMTVTNITGEFTCKPFGIHALCKYTASDAGSAGEIAVTGSDTSPTITATKVPLAKEEVSSGSCSNTATWSGTYVMSTPSSAWLT